MKLPKIAAAAVTAAGLLIAQGAAAAPAASPQGPLPAGKEVHTDGASNISGWAHVGSNGTLIQGSNAVRAVHINTGQYEVDFNSKLTKCAFTASAYLTGTSVGVEPRSGNIKGVFVYFTNLGGAPVNQQFYLVVTC